VPELPEAETIVRDLRARVVGATLKRVDVPREDILGKGVTPRRLNAALKGRRLEGVTRRGKNVVLLFNPSIRVMVNLGMSGRLVVSDAARASDLHHIAARFSLEDGRQILYDDIRRFGCIDLHTATTWKERDAELGVEPLSADFTAERLADLARTSRSPVRNWLLDQRKVAGVGNIYANEALYRARVRPDRPANSLRPAETRRLRDALVEVLQQAIDARGTTFDLYRDGNGEEGGYYARLDVYDREEQPCRKCRTPIERLVMSNRSAFLCPKCQK
jgi:formamidopyrimidine-DNA glycosylase